MAGHWCPVMHQPNPEARVDVKNDWLKAIEALLRLPRRRVHALMFKVGFYSQSLTNTKPIIKEAPVYLRHLCPTIRFA